MQDRKKKEKIDVGLNIIASPMKALMTSSRRVDKDFNLSKSSKLYNNVFFMAGKG